MFETPLITATNDKNKVDSNNKQLRNSKHEQTKNEKPLKTKPIVVVSPIKQWTSEDSFLKDEDKSFIEINQKTTFSCSTLQRKQLLENKILQSNLVNLFQIEN